MDRKKSTGKKYKKKYRDCPGPLVVSTQHCHFQGLGSIPGWGTKILQSLIEWPRKTANGQKQEKKPKLTSNQRKVDRNYSGIAFVIF